MFSEYTLARHDDFWGWRQATEHKLQTRARQPRVYYPGSKEVHLLGETSAESARIDGIEVKVGDYVLVNLGTKTLQLDWHIH